MDTTLFDIIHELTHYFQLINNISSQKLVINGKFFYADYILDEYVSEIDHP